VSVMTVNVEVICVGNELLTGKTLNTNAHWLSGRLTNIGASVNRITVVADDVREIAKVVEGAFSRKPTLIVSTGGLGPTFDDKTLEGIAEALKRRLIVNEDALKMVKRRYKEYGKTAAEGNLEMTSPRVKMATLPEGAVPIENPVGTAPAVRVEVGGTVLFALPGVPDEMKATFETHVEPWLRQITAGLRFHEKSIYVDELMESALAPLIDTVMRDNPGVYVKSHPKGKESMPHIEVHFSISSENATAAMEKIRIAAVQLADLVLKASGKVSEA